MTPFSEQGPEPQSEPLQLLFKDLAQESSHRGPFRSPGGLHDGVSGPILEARRVGCHPCEY